MNELIQDEETRPIRHKDVAKREETKQKSPERGQVENERELKRIEDRYYSANSKIPMYTEVPNREERDAESNEEIIQKYESVLSDINYEFKQLMKRNKELESKIEKGSFFNQPDNNLVFDLQKQIEDLK